MKSIIAWFAENHVAANLLMMFFIFAGVVTGLTMKVEVFPETTLDKINITTTYSGASPAEIEEAVVRRIEEKIAGLAGIKRIDSVSREGSGSVTIEVMSGWDQTKLLDEVKAEVDRITTLPDEAEKPVVQELVRRTQVINVVVYGDVSEATLKTLAERIKDDLTNQPGITLAEFFGVRNPEIHVEVSEDILRRHGLTLQQVAKAVQTASLDLPAGTVKSRGGEILIRTKGRRYRAKDYLNVPVITRSDGSRVTLGQIAKVIDGFEDVNYMARFQGKPAAAIQVYRVADQNALEVAAAVKKYVKEIRPTLPAGVEIDEYQDMSRILKSRIELLLKNMAMGLVLVALSLGGFLNRRLAFWVTLGIPVSFLFGLLLLPFMDVSINMVSLFAFIMVLGIVVDDAIVIGENIYSKQEEGLPPIKAAIEGAIEVGLPVIFSVLTTVAAFVPLLFGGGTMGKVMRTLPLVVIVVLAGSLVESLLILPCHLAGSRKKSLTRQRRDKEKRLARWLRLFIEGPYTRFLTRSVSWKYATVALGVAVLLLTVGTYTGGWLKFTFFPKVEGDIIQAFITMPAGTPLEETLEIVDRMEKSARAAMADVDRERPPGSEPVFERSVALVGVQAGGHGRSTETGSHLAHIYIQLLEGEQRNLSTNFLTKRWREKTGSIPEADSITFQSSLFTAGNPIELHLSSDDNDQLLAAVEDLKEELQNYPGVFAISDSFLPGKKEMQLKLKPGAATLGLTLNELALQVRHAFYGAEALRLIRDKDEVKVMIHFPESERRSLGYVENMRIRTSDGSEVPFRQVAEVRMVDGYAQIDRAQRRRVVKVTADVDESVTNTNEVRTTIENQYLPQLLADYPGLRYTVEGEGKEQKESMADVFRGFLVALFCIYALLAVPFKSFTQPFIVMAAIPFGIAGAAIGHLLMGYNLSLISMFGIVGLSGVVVNDSLVLIDAANRMRRQGFAAREAIIKAGAKRFRAILLTSVTTFAGLTPMILEKSLQARFLIPMAISLGFGVLFATGITLILIPCLYLILEDIQDLYQRLFLRESKSGSGE